MYFLIIALFSMLIFLFIYKLNELVFKIEDKNVSRNINKVKTQKKSQSKNEIFYILSRYIKMAKYKKEKMIKEFEWLGVEMSPEEYISEYLVKGIIGLIVTIILFILREFLPMGIALSGLALVITVQIVFKEKNKLKNTLAIRKRKVEEEAPFFIRFINTTLKSSNDLVGAFEKYSKVAKYLKNDIDRCLVEMKSSTSEGNSIIIALENLDERLNTPIIKDFTTGLVRANNGQDQSAYFEFLEKEVVKLSIHNMNLSASKVQKKVERAIFQLVLSLIPVIGIIFILIIKEQFTL